MLVKDVITQVIDLYNVTIDEALRNLTYVIRDINGSGAGLYDSVQVLKANKLCNGYAIPRQNLTGTCKVEDGSSGVYSNVVGTGTVFESELKISDKVVIDNVICSIQDITDNTHLSLMELIPEIEESFILQKATSLTEVTLTGREKFIYDIHVNSKRIKQQSYKEHITREDIVYDRTAYNTIEFNKSILNNDIIIQGLFALENKYDLDDSINIPYAWESVITSGMLYYTAKRKADADGVNLYYPQYSVALNDLDKVQQNHKPQVRRYWDYELQRTE